MANYGYGHSDPNQQLPTADEVVKQHDEKPSYDNVPPSSNFSKYDQLLSKGYPDAMKDKMFLKDDNMPFKVNLDNMRTNNGDQLKLKPPPLPLFNMKSGPSNMPGTLPPPPFMPGNGPNSFNDDSAPSISSLRFANRLGEKVPPMKRPFEGENHFDPNKMARGPPGPINQYRSEYNSNYNDCQSVGNVVGDHSGKLRNYTSLSELLHGPNKQGPPSSASNYHEYNREKLAELKKRLLDENVPKPLTTAVSYTVLKISFFLTI